MTEEAGRDRSNYPYLGCTSRWQELVKEEDGHEGVKMIWTYCFVVGRSSTSRNRSMVEIDEKDHVFLGRR